MPEGSVPSEKRANALSLGSVPVLKQLLTKATPRFLVRNALEDVYGDPSRVDERLVQRHDDMLLAAGNRQALMRALEQRRTAPTAEVDLWRRIPTISQPALVLWGGLDDWISPVAAQRFHGDLPHARLILYPTLGHVPMREGPAETASDVRAWLDAAAPAHSAGAP